MEQMVMTAQSLKSIEAHANCGFPFARGFLSLGKL
jgi:hypothetical protein